MTADVGNFRQHFVEKFTERLIGGSRIHNLILPD
jgi:hypothetical protein